MLSPAKWGYREGKWENSKSAGIKAKLKAKVFAGHGRARRLEDDALNKIVVPRPFGQHLEHEETRMLDATIK